MIVDGENLQEDELVPDEDAVGSEAAERRVAESRGTPAGRDILVLDDDEDILSLITYVLEAEGYEVRTATNGRAGLAALAEGLPDLILLDMKMPVMNGWEFARELQVKYDGLVPVIVITAAADAKRRADEIDASGWLGKPFDVDALLATVNRTIKAGHA